MGRVNTPAPPSLPSPLRRLQLAIRELGWIDAFWYATSVLAPLLTRERCEVFKYAIVAQAIPAAAPRARASAIEVRALAAADLHADAARLLRPAAVLAQRCGQGAECLAAYRNADLLGFMWLVCGPYDEDEVRARFVPAACVGAWDFDIEILPPHRMGMAFARLWDAANARLRARGVQWSYSRISAFNAPSRAAHKRAGALTVGSAVFVRCGRWQWTAATLGPYLHLSRGAASRPEFRLGVPRAAASGRPA
jgi:hypothetical protein